MAYSGWEDIVPQIASTQVGTAIDLTTILDLNQYRFIRVRGRASLTPAASVRYIWWWQSFLDQAGNIALDDAANTTGRADYLDTGSFAGATPVVQRLDATWGPGLVHTVATGGGAAGLVSVTHSRIPGPYAKLHQIHAGTPGAAMDLTLLVEGLRW